MIGARAHREPDATASLWRMPSSRKSRGRITSLPEWLGKGLVAVAVVQVLIGVLVALFGLAQVVYALVPALRSFSGVESVGTAVGVGLGVTAIGILCAAAGFVLSLVASSGLFLTTDSIVVLNVLQRHALRRADVSSVEVGRNFAGVPCLQLKTRNGQAVTAHYAGAQLTLREYVSAARRGSRVTEDETQGLARCLNTQLS